MLKPSDILMINETPKQHWDNLNQATMDKLFYNNNNIYTIKEQEALPFSDSYNDIEVIIDTVSDDLINTSKVYSDFVKIIFKDCNHKQNYKGQYYKIDIEGTDESYICYDRINKLHQTATTKLVRCNNVLTWKDEYDNIITMPCYLGTDISSTNNLISKDATIPNARMIILIQANDFTLNIKNNQRFMFQHSTCFKVEEVNNYMQEQGTNGEVTCVKIYVDHSTILPTDNKELNICDYYDIIEKESTNNQEMSDDKVIFVSPNEKVVIKQGKYIDIKANVYIGEDIQTDLVECVGSGINEDNYRIERIESGFRIYNNKLSSNPLTLTFKAEDCEDVSINVLLRGVL